MKRFLMIMLSLLMLVACYSCKDSGGEDSSAEAKDIVVWDEADAIIAKYSLAGGECFSTQSGGKTLDEDLIRSLYGDATAIPDFGSVEEYAIYVDETKPLKPCEFGIFKMKEGADKEAFVAFLKARINLKIQNAVAYPTLDTEPLKTAKFTIKGNYVWYCAVSQSNDAINSDLEGKL